MCIRDRSVEVTVGAGAEFAVGAALVVVVSLEPAHAARTKAAIEIRNMRMIWTFLCVPRCFVRVGTSQSAIDQFVL